MTCKSVQNKEINNNLQINLKHMQTNNKKVKKCKTHKYKLFIDKHCTF